ncbi:MAG TPA: ArsA-related P-loop ATPase [Acidimicrobiales bacterium]|nr:ArsA-related P-loop ATPase [Acidimicrobiales bacterium]
MDVEAFCRQSRFVLVVGKGGVGKTTVAASLARMAAGAGLEVLLLALDERGDLAPLFGRDEPLDYAGTRLWEAEGGGAVDARLLTSDAALLEYLGSHGLGRVSRRLVQSGALDVVATAIPGIREVLVLGKVKQLERDRAADLIVLDAPSTGHALSFLTSSGGLAGASRGGPLRRQAEEVLALLGDPERCQVLLATIPEETPVNEVIETAYRVEDEIGVALRAVVVNACERERPALAAAPAEAARKAGAAAEVGDLERVAAAAAFRRARISLQSRALERLASELPLPQLRLPLLAAGAIGPAELTTLSAALEQAVARL